MTGPAWFWLLLVVAFIAVWAWPLIMDILDRKR